MKTLVSRTRVVQGHAGIFGLAFIVGFMWALIVITGASFLSCGLTGCTPAERQTTVQVADDALTLNQLACIAARTAYPVEAVMAECDVANGMQSTAANFLQQCRQCQGDLLRLRNVDEKIQQEAGSGPSSLLSPNCRVCEEGACMVVYESPDDGGTWVTPRDRERGGPPLLRLH